MPPENSVSLREYARLNSCDEKIIRRAIEAGKIPANAVIKDNDNGRPLILVSEADASWGIYYREKRAGKRSRSEPKPGNKKTVVKLSGKRSNGDMGDTIDESFDLSETDGLGTNPKDKSKKLTYSDADRLCKILDAKMKQVRLHEMKGRLVPREIIEKTFFESGKIVRESILAIPDRIIDELITMGKSRNEAHILLQDSLTQALESLSTIPDLQI